MEIPSEVFKMRRYPPFGLYVLTIIPCFFLFGIGGGILASLLPSGTQLIAFPLLPIFLTIFLADYLQPPAEVRTDAQGMTLLTLRHSVGLKAGESFWPWQDLRSFKLASNKGVFLLLQFGQEEVTFSGNGVYPLRDFLKKHFPEQEKKSFWSWP